MAKTGYKKGAFSKQEIGFIKANAFSMSPTKIAEELNRPYQRIYDYIQENIRPEIKQVIEGDPIHELQNTADWQQLQKELTVDELVVFKEQYKNMVDQFEKDILYTERQQMFQSIKFHILMSRNMVNRKRADEDLAAVQKQYANWLMQFNNDFSAMAPIDRAFQTEILQLINGLKREVETKSSEYKILHDQYRQTLESLKAVRSDRVKSKREGRGRFLDLLNELREDEKNAKEGREAELARMAMEKKIKELSEPFKFANNEIGSMLVTVDTLVRPQDHKEEENG